MISYFSAISLILNNSRFIFDDKKQVSVNVEKSVGMVSSENVYSSHYIPKFNNSAMDGFAVKSKLLSLNDSKFKEFHISNILKAGSYFDSRTYFDDNHVVEIMTGARVPNCFDSVVKYEDSNISFDKVSFNKRVFKGENIRFAGEDYKIDDIILKKGEMINDFHIMSLLSLGFNYVNVFKKIKIYIICTGSEITDDIFCLNNKYDDFLYNVSYFYLSRVLEKLNFNFEYFGVVKDNVHEFMDLLEFALVGNDLCLVITTGAVSKGKADFIFDSLFKYFDPDVIFHEVKIKPGKPVLFSKLKKNAYFFGLPGNPISTIVGFRFFVYPFLRFISYLPLEKLLKARLSGFYINNTKFDLFLKAKLDFKENVFVVTIIKEQESFKISSLVECNCFAFIKSGTSYIDGQFLDVFLLDYFL